jgi:deoxyribodipyrimidine photo-lyase
MSKTFRLGIHWYRRDLRIADHQILQTASQQCEAVLPCYVVSTWKQHHAWTGPNRQQFLCDCLRSLDANLRTLGSRLLIRHGKAEEALRQLIIESGADALFFQRDPDPFGKMTESAVERICAELGVKVHAMHDVSLHSPTEILTGDQLPYRVYTPYSKNWLSKPKEQPVGKLTRLATPDHLASDPLPTLATWGLPASTATIVPAGEKAARQRFRDALQQRIAGYAEKRDIPSLDGTTRISQDLRFGLLSLRSIYAATQQAMLEAPAPVRTNHHTYLKELAWREFYFAILHFYPEVLEVEFAPQWRGLPWDEPDEKLTAWQQGRTGFPIVDAGMRELLATGHMHNRVRMIVAMFLTKDLHYDWRLGESWFMRHLVDGEIASNNGGWQWSAGTGADAAPYFRIQNPWSQTLRFDPQGLYIKRWVPELAQCPPKLFLTPPADGRPIAADYPLPIVDHNTERLRTLAVFQQHKAEQR